MSPLPSEVWVRLKGGAPHGEDLTARYATPDVTDRLLGAIDAEGRRHLLISLHSTDEDLTDNQSRGIFVVSRELQLLGHQRSRYIDLVCTEVAGHDAFDVIGGEIAQQLASAKANPAVGVERVLSRWRRFWGQLPQHILAREEQLGLFAEVWFLDTWMIQRVGTSAAVDRWRGPSGARHDFESVGLSVEVKATISSRGRIHRIHGLDQLAPPEEGELLLFSLQLREEAGASNTLPDAVKTCREHLQSDDAALTGFETKLLQAGYSPAHEEEYSRLRFRILSEGLFRVGDTFPRLTLSQLAGGLPSGIEHIEYEINLSGFDHLLVAGKPSEGAML